MSPRRTATPAALAARLAPAAAAVSAELLAGLRADRSRLPALFPGLPRRIGREPVRGGRTALGPGTVDLDAFRACDLAAAWLLLEADVAEPEARDLYGHGDIEERTMLLRALHFLPVGPLTVRLFGEVQRTNMVVHFEAAVCDGDLFARTLGQPGFDEAAANRLLLKLAFLDLPLRRVLGAERHANAGFSRMLQDLATEREAAGRAVWRDTGRMIGRAPVAGTAARLVGGLEHGDDAVRLAAAEGLLALGQADLRAFAAERLPREPRETVRAVLARIAAS
ncbi:MAG: hypothetical protein FJ265_21730 [Planctomycetes bacterium]|nr:hypothetical protein [Planctomycetota bacterium]